MDEFSQLDPVYAAWFYFRMGEYDSGQGFTTRFHGPPFISGRKMFFNLVSGAWIHDIGASAATEMLKMDPEAKLPWAIKMVNLTENVKNLNEDESAEAGFQNFRVLYVRWALV